jgi:hypothetical protein
VVEAVHLLLVAQALQVAEEKVAVELAEITQVDQTVLTL